MANLTIEMLNNFISTARNDKGSELLKSFLRLIIFQGGISKSGSILVHHQSDDKLHLFNDENFLFVEGFLDSTTKWRDKFGRFEGLAGLAFSTRNLQYSEDVSKDGRYLGDDESIKSTKSLVCAPIVLASHPWPFGVASFFNGPSGPPFDEDARNLIRLSVNTLSLALQVSKEELGRERSKSVFIVHGRDMAAVTTLKLILEERRIQPVVLADQPRVGQELLQKFEEILKTCRAGFVLLTPDDEGRLKSDTDVSLSARARQNVIFEAGWLAAILRDQRKICFLKTGALELPSDIQGVLTESFDVSSPDISRIEAILTDWGIEWTPRAR